MPKQINVKLGFEADTKQAKAQIADLQKSLDNLMNSSIKNSATTGFDAQISKAQQSVLKLKTAIDNSLNADTGRLDLSKFNQQLNNSGMSLTSLSKDMNNLGADGQKAFLNLANSIVTAQKPMIESNKLLDNMWTALKNTARWQLSSSILHGFMGALQGAYGYAQDLNRSLTDIAIVTGRSVDQMAAFAEQANKSAQALSVSTTAYTDAALIYYQQGLNDEEVKARTDITMQMSNVTRESAEHVSSYMTAIWNNFADGSDNLTHFADVITALGAATASSSEEIANGMQQFAAVADTVGLSYEYAATALATVVAQTRQSESTVGNSFRTIFSRLQGLKLGETLEDGTSLNKYSEALMKVGVDIKDQNGDLKDMNTILDEIGAKWQSLAKDQQIALAQTVGGVRQYTNLVALFDNWDKFQENLKVANGSDGALQEQADIYAQSWEAAQKRVRAAWQALYQDLIDDKFFITITDGLAAILKGVDNLIDGIGGLPGVLSAIGVIITTVFNKQLVQGLQNAQQQLRVLNGTAQAESDAMAVWVKHSLDEQRPKGDVQDQTIESLTIDSAKQRLALTIELREVYDQLSDAQRDFANNLLDSVQAQQQLTIEAKKTEDAQRKAAEDAMRQLRNSITASGADKELTHFMNGGEVPGIDKTFSEQIKNLSQLKKGTTEYNDAYQELFETMVIFSNGTEKQINLIERFIDAKLDAVEASNNFKKAQEASDTEIDNFNSRLQQLIQNHHNGFLSTDELIEALEKEKKVYSDTSEEAKKLQLQIDKLNQSKNNSPDLSQNIVKAFQSINQLTMAITTVSNAIDVWNSKDLTWTEKLGKTLPSLLIAIPQLAAGLKTLKEISSVNSIMAGFKAVLTGAAGGVGLLATGLRTLAVDILAVAGPIAVVIGLIWAIKTGWDAWQATTPEGIFKRLSEEADNAKKSLQEATDAANTAKDAYKNLSDIFDNFEEKSNGIDKIKEGTLEWKQAIADANLELINALDSANLLGKVKINYDKRGLAQIDKDSQEVVLNKANQNTLIQTTRQLIAQNFSNQKQFETNIQGLANELKRFAVERKTYSAGAAYSGNEEPYYSKSNIQKGSPEMVNFLNEYGKKLADAGYAGKSADEILKAFKSDSRLNFLSHIPNLENRTDILDAISNAADQISTSDKTSDSYKTELGRQVADELGIDVKNFEQNAVYKAIGNYLGDPKKLEETVAGLTDKDRALYAQNIQGVEWNGKNFTDEKGEKIEIDPYSVAQLVLAVDAINHVNIDAEDFKQSIAQAKTEAVEELNRQLKDVKIQIDKSNIEGLPEFFNSLSNEDKALTIGLNIEEEGIEDLKDFQNWLEGQKEGEHHLGVDLDTAGLTKKQTAELEEEFDNLTEHIQKNAKAVDELDDSLKFCKRGAQEVAYAIIRFDDAIQDVSENYDDWMRSLKSGAWQDVQKATKDLQKTYGNLLDIDGSKLSQDFLENTKNLELMKQAINGNIDSYDKLVNLAGADYLKTTLKLDDNTANDLINEYNDVINRVYPNFEDIPVHASLEDADFISGLEDMLNKTAMTTTQAQEFLSNMGVDAEVVEDTSKVRDTKQLVGAIPEPTPPIEIGATTTEASGVFSELAGAARYAVTGYTMKPDIQTETEDKENTSFALKIKSAKKSTGGNIKYKQASHGGGGKSTGGGGKGKKGGGGGGGSKKKEVKQPKEHVKKEDRYHDIKEQLDDVQKAYDKVNKAKDRAFGKSKLKYLDQEIDLLKQEDKLLKQYVKEIESYAKKDLESLTSLGIGAEFDDTGKLLNYEAVLKRIVDDQNAAIDKFNQAQEVYNKSAQSEADKEILERAQKELEAQEKVAKDREEKLKQYNDTYNLWQDQTWAELQKRWELYDKELEKTTLKVEMELDFNEADLKLLQFLFDNLGDGVDKATDKIANLNKQMSIYENNIEIYRNGMKEIFGNHGIDIDLDNMDPGQLLEQLVSAMSDDTFVSELTADEAKYLREYGEGLTSTVTELKERLDDIHQVVTDTFDKWMDDLDDVKHGYERLNKLLEHNKKIIELTGKDFLKISNDTIKAINQQSIKVAQDVTASNKEIMEGLQEEAAKAQAQLDKALAEGDEISITYWKDHLKQINEAAEEAEDEFQSSFENTMELVNQAFEESIDMMVEDFKNSFAGMNIDDLVDKFNRQKEIDELYLPEFKKYQELNKATNDLNKSLQKTNNTVIKGKMNDLMGEINDKISSGAKMSQYETEIIARRVALLQAEDQLLAARQAKSAVRMTRDNEGNFSYTYTADQEAIGDAQDNYNQHLAELIEYERNANNEIQSWWLQKQQEFADRLRDITEKYKEGSDEYNQALAELQEEYDIYADYYLDQQNMIFDEMARARDDDWKDYERIFGLKLATADDFITKMDESILGRLVPDYQTAEDSVRNFSEAEQNAIDTAIASQQIWEENTRATFQAAGETVDTYGQKVVNNIGEIGTKSDETKQKVSDMVGNMKTNLDEVMQKAAEVDSVWGKRLKSMQDSVGGVVGSLNDLLRKLDQVINKAKDTITDVTKAAQTAANQVAAAQQQISGGSGGSNSGGGGSNKSGSNGSNKTTSPPSNNRGPGKTSYKYYLTSTNEMYDTMGEGTSKGNLYGGVLYKYTYVDGTLVSSERVTIFSPKGISSGGNGHGNSSNVNRFMKLDTGGYTGEWGKEGRLAMLHQKEIVLNEDDTKNLLKSVDLIRDMKDLFQTKISMGNFNYNVLAGAGTADLQQQVHIDASFPNVVDHNEIELALNNLVNSTTQFINRRRAK